MRVIGVGNALRQDDGAGPAVVRQLSGRIPAGVQLLCHHGEGVDLLHLWQGAKQVVIVDAVCAGAVVGTIYRFEATREPLPKAVFASSSHLFGVADAVELARNLDRLPEQLWVYGIEGMCFGYGEGLSPAVAVAVAVVAGEVAALLSNDGLP